MRTTRRARDADHGTPASVASQEPRYLGYRQQDRERPYAAFFDEVTAPIQPDAAYALIQGMAPSEWGVSMRDLPSSLGAPGRARLENGWTRHGARTYVAVHTRMPGCTAEMWQWWFGWHSRESARYKLWNPDAHQFCTLKDDRAAVPGLTDEEKYVDNVSFVDEYIGGRMQRLAIRFVRPSTLGFDHRAGWAHVCARVGFSGAPLTLGWLVHQVRPTSDGCEMRSRFVLNDAALELPHRAVHIPARLSASALPASIGPDMIYHCAAEMNHLARFLPALHEQFRDMP